MITLYTLGHGNHPLPHLIRLLEDNGVMTLVDVRTAPYSRFNPQFNKDSLESALPQHNIQYVFAGKYLGGRPTDPALYKSRTLPTEDHTDYLHEVDYPAIMQRDYFQRAIQRLLQLADEQTTAILCSEEDPATCHRHHLIAKYLMEHHPEVNVRHIRGDGTVFGARSLRVSIEKPDAQQPPLF